MKNNKFYLFIIIIFTFLAGNFVYPYYWNKTAEKVKSVFNLSIPDFPSKEFQFGLDLKGGIELIYEIDFSGKEIKNKKEVLNGLKEIIEKRVNYFGVSEPIVQVRKGEDRYQLSVALSGIKEMDKAIEMVGKAPYLEFREEMSLEEQEQQSKKIIKRFPEDKIEKFLKEIREQTSAEITKEDLYKYLKFEQYKPTNLTGQYLESSEISFDPNTGEPVVLLNFNKQGSEIFKELTSKNIEKTLAIYIDGILISAPTVRTVIPNGRAEISGGFKIQQAKELARNLNAGALSIPMKGPISQKKIGPSLGMVSLEKSVKAGIFGFLALIIFLILYYRFLGFIAVSALIIYVITFLTIFKIIPVTLTLAGIAAFILSIGMAVDANILIFSRLKEEIKSGRNFEDAIEIGYKRVWPSVRDSNLTSLIICLILFYFGQKGSFLQGFSLILIIGILLNIFSALVITKIFLINLPHHKT